MIPKRRKAGARAVAERGVIDNLTHKFLDDPGRNSALVLLHTSPAWIGILISIKPLLPGSRQVVDLAFSTAVGVTVALIGWSITTLIKRRFVEEKARAFSEVQEAVAFVPPRELMRALVGPMPGPLLDYLANERNAQKEGFLSLQKHKAWELTTQRAYESIVHFLRSAEHVQIVDHDIRRWFELLDQPRQKSTSTTFNYSQYILGVAQDGFRKGKLRSYRRIFMLNERLPCDLNRREERWDRLKPAVQVLLTIWEFEDRIRKMYRLNHGFGTRVLVHNSRLTGELVEQINEFKDLVIVNGEVCFHENLHCNVHQLANTTSFDTKSWLYTDEKYVGRAPAFFEALWENANGVEHYKEAGEWLRKFPRERQVRILGADELATANGGDAAA